MAAPYVVNLSINAGSSFTQLYHLEGDGSSPLNLSGYDIDSQLRKHPQSASYINFIATTNGPPSSGVIKLELTPESTVSLKPGRYVYDVIITNLSSGVKTRVIEGSALITQNVTRVS